jgi:DNA-nicking Smr family endonuclease
VNDEPPDDDAALFRAAMRQVRKIKAQPRVTPTRRTPPAAGRTSRPTRPNQPTHSAHDPHSDAFPTPRIVRTVTGDERLSFRRPGLQDSVLRKLRRGQFPVGAEIDLHGLTATEADAALRRFLGGARARGVRCVRIVHGKGQRSGERGAVLKSEVNALLENSPAVLAFVSASREDGGTGATWVLLRSAASS